MTDLERARAIIERYPVVFKTGVIEEIAAALVAVREEERQRVLGLLEEWREGMTSVGQLHSLECMLSEVRNGDLPA